MRNIWRQFDAYVNVNYHMVDLDIPQPVAEDMYYATYSAIDRQKEEGVMT